MTVHMALANQAIHPFAIDKLVPEICLGNKTNVVMGMQ